MIIFEKTEDIFTTELQTLVCPVNVWGRMGKGLALTFRDRFPGLYEAYQNACWTDHFKKHGIFVHGLDNGKKVLCLPTKYHWRQNANWRLIDRGLETIFRDYVKYGITSIAMPAIGAGQGHLPWEEVYPLVRRYMDPLPIEVGLYYYE